MSPNSQHMTTALSSRSPTHHSDLEGSHAPATAADAVLLYSEVNRTQGVSTNGSSSYAYAMYSETSDTTVGCEWVSVVGSGIFMMEFRWSSTVFGVFSFTVHGHSVR